ncbi:hypothetical protein ACFR99_04670 [Haloarchaeobius amylolyticus]|uniref:Polysaccharide lyase-like protein n=1 Tax=Haloarchaeobius amylolyticus TaxID=1198296 RepID=A0ABD6BDU6_9EURY
MGVAAAAFTTATNAVSATPSTRPVDSLEGDSEAITIDYDQYTQPSEIYDVWTGDETTASFIDTPTTASSQALEMAVKEGDSWGTNAMYSLPENGYGQPTQAYQRIMVRLSDDWTMQPNDVCRVMAMGFNTEAGTAGSGVRGPPAGDNGWSSVICVTNREDPPAGTYRLATYTYHMDYDSGAGEFEVTDTAIPVGEWVSLESYVRMNTHESGTANHDGVVRYWLDGELAFERENYRWTTTDGQAIEYVGPIVRYGGGEVAPQDQSFRYDEHEISVSTNAAE